MNKTFLTLIFGSVYYMQAFADIAKPDGTFGLPFENSGGNKPHAFLSKGIAEAIKYVGLLAVFSIVIGGIMYMTSFGEEGKTKKAKNLIIYSIVGVIVAGLAYALVGIVNSIRIGT